MISCLQRLENQVSYVQGSQRYLDKYVSARLKADDFAQHYAYTAYEWRTPQVSPRRIYVLKTFAVRNIES